MSLDVCTALCKKAWYMFDDSGETAICTFRPDGILLISAKGETCKMTWQYAQRSHSMKLHGDGKEWELHTVFMDGTLFVLQADDTLRYAFFTDEKSPARSIPELETVLERYFIDKEQEKQNAPIAPPKSKAKTEEPEPELNGYWFCALIGLSLAVFIFCGLLLTLGATLIASGKTFIGKLLTFPMLLFCLAWNLLFIRPLRRRLFKKK